ncbi:profilin-1-like [Erpetoichthys calabaricus]|uniref:Profilin n=1 Tax=Erpetoichthys calabaricus TaxID=27687 RepID=A0A8C4S2K9_ERPCA|nr:profilin-1-like [Erpetoichthys calabaricus]
MSWQGYVNSLMADGTCQDAAIIGYKHPNQSVWASVADKFFQNITIDEINALLNKDRSPMLINGLHLGGLHCSVLRDSLFVDGENTIDLRTKASDGPTFNICLAKANQTFVAVMGAEGTSGGNLNKKAFDMRDYLKKASF